MLTMPSIPVAVNVLAQAHPDAGIGTRLRVASLNRHGPQSSPSSSSRSKFGKQDFRYAPYEDVYICPAGEKLTYSFSTEDKGLVSYEKTWRCSTNGSSNTALEFAPIGNWRGSSLPFAA